MDRRNFLQTAVGALGSVLLVPAVSQTIEAAESEAGKDKPAGSPAGQTAAAAQPRALPEPRLGDKTVGQALKGRRSRREYAKSPLGLAEVAAILFAAQGITQGSGDKARRAVPSAGALYPMSLYLFARDISGLDKGLYRYDEASHGLIALRAGDLSAPLSEACGQRSVAEAPVVFVIAASFERAAKKYGDRGQRYAAIEAGGICQSIYLSAESLGLGTVAVGGFKDEKLNALLGLDGVREGAVLMHPVGKL